jgi:hypothetical protein
MASAEIFIIPSPGNAITERDVIKKQVRITKDFKSIFQRIIVRSL